MSSLSQHPGLCAGGSRRTNGSRYLPSAHAAALQGGFNRLHQLLHGFLSFQNHLPSPASFKLSLLKTDPTTAASERSSIKNRRSRRRGSGMNRHRSRTVSKRSLRGARHMRVQGVQGQECPQHESTQPGPLTLLPHNTRVRHKKQAQVQTVSKTSLRGVESLGVGGVQRIQQGGPGRGPALGKCRQGGPGSRGGFRGF